MSNDKRVFISREQTTDSVFSRKLSRAGFKVHGELLITITGIPFAEIPHADWIFFYSKNGVKYFFENPLHSLPKTGGKPIPKLATIGPGTADFLEENYGHPHFVGDGNAKTTAELFLKRAAGKKILFPRARDSRRSVQQWIEGKAVLIDLIVYDNVPKKDFDLPDFDILVFTSPLNAKAYFSKKKWKDGQKVIAIGKTTKEALM